MGAADSFCRGMRRDVGQYGHSLTTLVPRPSTSFDRDFLSQKRTFLKTFQLTNVQGELGSRGAHMD